MRKQINLNKGITINAEAFIIPNSATTIDGFFTRKERIASSMKKVGELNGFEFDPKNTKLIETWLVSDEYECDNIADHSILTTTEDGARCSISISSGCRRFLPSTLFEGKREGDIINVKLPVRVSMLDKEDWEDHDVIADFTITLAQKKYRYRSFGAFEEVLKYVKTK